MAKKTNISAQKKQSLSKKTPISDPPAQTSLTQKIDLFVSRNLSRVTRGSSPHAYGLAFFDWATHLLTSPGKQLELLTQSPKKDPATAAKDLRFNSPSWERFPFSLFKQLFLFQEAWIDAATSDVAGVEQHHQKIVNSTLKQMHELASPAMIPFLNPEVLRETYNSRGQNLKQGFKNFVDDCTRLYQGKGPAGVEFFKVGEHVAITPGKVVYRNELIELIQYLPTTAQLNAEPILIVPAWIMKYYILDLSPKNSFVKYLVEQGNTVFMISWRNPGQSQHDLSLEDYLELGVGSAIDAIQSAYEDRASPPRIHALGYCLGGTLLSIAAAAYSRKSEQKRKNTFQSVTLLAAQTDFTEAGEIRRYIDESQLQALEENMKLKGYLDGAQMGAAFAMLRPYELVGARIIQEYYLGKRGKMIDIMAWNADTTRLPARMHTEYLRRLYLHNDLAEGRFMVAQEPIAIQDISVPLFVVGTRTDHVAPWRSVFKIHLLNSGDLTFLLTAGGHNAGIVSEPGHAGRDYQVKHRPPHDVYVSPEEWVKSATHREGSWWPEWTRWITQHSSAQVNPPEIKTVLDEAPGQYVMQK